MLDSSLCGSYLGRDVSYCLRRMRALIYGGGCSRDPLEGQSYRSKPFSCLQFAVPCFRSFSLVVGCYYSVALSDTHPPQTVQILKRLMAKFLYRPGPTCGRRFSMFSREQDVNVPWAASTSGLVNGFFSLLKNPQRPWFGST